MRRVAAGRNLAWRDEDPQHGRQPHRGSSRPGRRWRWLGFPGLGGGGGLGIPMKAGGGHPRAHRRCSRRFSCPTCSAATSSSSPTPASARSRPDRPPSRARPSSSRSSAAAVNDVSDYWIVEYPRAFDGEYREADTVFFAGATNTGCGQASAQIGPFYCPADELVYFDLDFLTQLQNQFGATGDLAAQYIVAHEYGHHVQNVLGMSSEVSRRQQQDPASANRYSVALELQADCFAGAWASDAEQRAQLDRGRDQRGPQRGLGRRRRPDPAAGRRPDRPATASPTGRRSSACPGSAAASRPAIRASATRSRSCSGGDDEHGAGRPPHEAAGDAPEDPPVVAGGTDHHQGVGIEEPGQARRGPPGGHGVEQRRGGCSSPSATQYRCADGGTSRLLRPGATTSIKVTSAADALGERAAVAATWSLWPDPLSSPTTSCRYPLSLGRQHGPTSSSGTTPAPAAAADEVVAVGVGPDTAQAGPRPRDVGADRRRATVDDLPARPRGPDRLRRLAALLDDPLDAGAAAAAAPTNSMPKPPCAGRWPRRSVSSPPACGRPERGWRCAGDRRSPHLRRRRPRVHRGPSGAAAKGPARPQPPSRRYSHSAGPMPARRCHQLAAAIAAAQ